MKPKWFYEHIGRIAKTDVKMAKRAFDAELLDEVSVNVEIIRDYIDYEEWGYDTIRVPGRQEITAVVTDERPIYVKDKFPPMKFMIRPESIIYWVEDMKPDTGQFRAIMMFESMYIDQPLKEVHLHSSNFAPTYTTEYIHTGGWEHHNYWYLVYPNMLSTNSGGKRSVRSIF